MMMKVGMCVKMKIGEDKDPEEGRDVDEGRNEIKGR